ncbi:MAG: ParB/RepB/Spo0J family partition protein [Lachnospiraceae bacterium]|nr:ParB/RepB/Spo0J family partition protein [Lachnospiraceae bacterium]
MSKRNLGDRIKLSSYEDMFGEEDTISSPVEQKPEGQIVEVPLDELHSFENHPFRVIDDEAMQEMVDSIKQYGVLVPAIARPREQGGYELLSGHRRHHASEIVGKVTMPVIIKDCNDDEATVIMVDANIQREDILISEKARAYRMKYDAMKHQGAAGGFSLKEMSEQAGDSMKTIQRLICVADLDENLLNLLDQKKLGIRQGVDLSFLTKEQQAVVYKMTTELSVSLSWEDSTRIKEAGKKGYLNADYLKDILTHDKPKVRKVIFNQKKLDDYFEPNMSSEDIEELIVKLLDEWKERGGHS